MRTIIVFMDTAAPLVAFFAAAIFMRSSNKSKTEKWLMLYLLTTGLLNGLCNVLSEVFYTNNHLVYHVENLLNILFLSLFFSTLKALSKYKYYIIYTIIPVIIFNISFTLIEGNYFIFDSVGFGSQSVLFTIYSLLFYAGLMQSQKGENLFQLPEFWYVTGFLFYFACCFFIFILYQHYTNLGVLNIGVLWKFQNIMLSIMSIFIIKGFLCRVSRTSLSLL